MRYLFLFLAMTLALCALGLVQPAYAQSPTPSDTPTDTQTPTLTVTPSQTPTATPVLYQYITLSDGQNGAVFYTIDAGEVGQIIIQLIILGVLIFGVILMLRSK